MVWEGSVFASVVEWLRRMAIIEARPHKDHERLPSIGEPGSVGNGSRQRQAGTPGSSAEGH